MRSKSSDIANQVLATTFNLFVQHAFRANHSAELGNQPYVDHVCHVVTKLIDGDTRRLLINLPPQHLKTFVCTICLIAFYLGRVPSTRILLVAYNDEFAASLASKVRTMMSSDWYQRIFRTRIQIGHARANDFATTEGGSVFAVSATGAITGRSADVIVYDDPHQIDDWNNERELAAVRDNFNNLLSRLHDKRMGAVIVTAHRIAENDLSAYLMEQIVWTRLRLPLRAVRNREYDLGHDTWARPKGDILRPDAYSNKEVERLERTQVSPPFDFFYQQAVGSRTIKRVRPEHFGKFNRRCTPPSPVVLSVDPGHGGGGEHASRTAIQAWMAHLGNFYLLGEFCEKADAETLITTFRRFAKKYRSGFALIENTANGPALEARLRARPVCEIQMIAPREPKLVRFDRHRATICAGRILLPEDALWRTAFIDDVVNFPDGHDDRVDAMTQYLDFASNGRLVAQPPVRSAPVTVFAPDPYRRRHWW